MKVLFIQFIKAITPRGIRKKTRRAFFKFLRTCVLFKRRLFKQKMAVIKKIPLAKIKYNLNRPMHFEMYLRSNYEPHIYKIAKSTLKSGDVVLDIGAHIGYWSLVFSQLVSEKGSVYSFECLPQNYDSFTQNIKLNRKQNIKAYPYCLSDNNSMLFFNPVTQNDGGGHVVQSQSTESIAVQGVSWDHLNHNELKLKQKPKLVKMDVEGHQVQVLNGMKNLLMNHSLKPETFVIEAGFDLKTRKEVYDFMVDHGYDLYDINRPQNPKKLLFQDCMAISQRHVADMFFRQDISSC